ncbi:MAG: hypothetical protein UU61_C0032G0006 [Parcubacteria group bacterium GW2011_GWB1_41_4]|nr:MAG: hypothetical protein UU61_C0032G0006 [Parcubacteria group bacterium GW2011_GWB1_41_4]
MKDIFLKFSNSENISTMFFRYVLVLIGFYIPLFPFTSLLAMIFKPDAGDFLSLIIYGAIYSILLIVPFYLVCKNFIFLNRQKPDFSLFSRFLVVSAISSPLSSLFFFLSNWTCYVFGGNDLNKVVDCQNVVSPLINIFIYSVIVFLILWRFVFRGKSKHEISTGSSTLN